MDQSALAMAAFLVAVVALLLGAGGAVAAGRGRTAQRTMAAAAAQLREQVEAVEDEVARLKDTVRALAGESGPAREVAADAAGRLQAITGSVEDLQDDVRDGAIRADGLDARIRLLEGRLRDLASEPPPIPSGRRPGRLDGLRAVLRAQAATEAGVVAEAGEDAPATPEAEGDAAAAGEPAGEPGADGGAVRP